MADYENMTGVPTYSDEEEALFRLTEANFDRVKQPNGVQPRAAGMTGKTMHGFRAFVRDVRANINKEKVNRKIKEYNTKLYEINKYASRLEQSVNNNDSSFAIRQRVRRAEKAGKELAKLGVSIFILESKQLKLEGKPKAIKVPSEVKEKAGILSAIGLMKFLERREEKKIIREEVSRIMKEIKEGETADLANLQKQNLTDFVIEKMKEKGFENTAEEPVNEVTDELGSDKTQEFRTDFGNAMHKGSLTKEESEAFKAYCDANGLNYANELQLATDTARLLGQAAPQVVPIPEPKFDINEALKTGRTINAPTPPAPPFIENGKFDINEALKMNREEIKAIFARILAEHKEELSPKQQLENAMKKRAAAKADYDAFIFSGVNDPVRAAELKAALDRAVLDAEKATEVVLTGADKVIEEQKSKVEPVITVPPVTDRVVTPVVEENTQRVPVVLQDNYNPFIDGYTMTDMIAEILPNADIRNEKGKVDADKVLTVQRTQRLEIDNYLADRPEYQDRYRQLQIYDSVRNRDGSLSQSKLKSNPHLLDELSEINLRQSERREQYNTQKKEEFLNSDSRQAIIAENRKRSEELREKIAKREAEQKAAYEESQRQAQINEDNRIQKESADRYRSMFYKVGVDYSSIDDRALNNLMTQISDAEIANLQRRGTLFDEVAQSTPKEKFGNDEDKWYSHVVSVSKSIHEEEKGRTAEEPSRTR